jgi:hypothetical protein
MRRFSEKRRGGGNANQTPTFLPHAPFSLSFIFLLSPPAAPSWGERRKMKEEKARTRPDARPYVESHPDAARRREIASFGGQNRSDIEPCRQK